jgi:predicted nucleotidyltransferase
MRAQISANLKAIESRHDVRILFACESGSRGWGFASPDSDYDVRFIYVHCLPWYLQVSNQRTVIEEPITGDLDINGWELRKALGLLKKGNATLIEWLDSPIIYQSDEAFLSRLRESASLTHRAERSFYHYVHMARKNYREYLQGDSVRLKKYLYVLRPLLATLWIEQGRGIAPMPFQSLVDTLISDAELLVAIEQLLRHKRAAKESEYGRPLPVINQFIAKELTRLESILPPVIRDTDFSVLDQLLMDVVMRQTSDSELA